MSYTQKTNHPPTTESKMDNYPDDIRVHDNDPRSPFYEPKIGEAGCACGWYGHLSEDDWQCPKCGADDLV